MIKNRISLVESEMGTFSPAQLIPAPPPPPPAPTMVTDQGLPPVAEFPFGSPGPLSSSQKPRGSAQDLDGANKKYLVSGTLIAWACSSVAFPSFPETFLWVPSWSFPGPRRSLGPTE